jgi:hypothetical protein
MWQAFFAFPLFLISSHINLDLLVTAPSKHTSSLQPIWCTHTYAPTHDTHVARKGTTKYKPLEDKSAIKIFSNSELIWQTASTEPDASDVYMRRTYPAGSNICVIQRGFHYIRIREMDSQNLLIYLYIRGTPWLGMSIFSVCSRHIFNKGVDLPTLSADRLWSYTI